jgi:hypothetical protein
LHNGARHHFLAFKDDKTDIMADESQNGGRENGKPRKRRKISALVAAAKARSAVDQVIARSAQDVRGSNDLPNTGPTINYENES